MSSFITPILAKFSAELEAAVEGVKANILREFEGLAQQSSARSSSVAKPAAKPAFRSPGQKRTPEALERDTEHVFSVIKSNPGLRIELLAAKGGMTTSEMVLPIKKLRDAKRITTAGSKRATTYTVKAAK